MFLLLCEMIMYVWNVIYSIYIILYVILKFVKKKISCESSKINVWLKKLKN